MASSPPVSTLPATAPVTYRGVVYPWHCDHVGHMNVMWYVGKFDEATWQLMTGIGLTPSFLRQHKRGMAAVDQHLNYLRELRAGDTLTVRSALLEIKDKSLRFLHEMTHDESGDLAARCMLVGVHLDTEQRRACALPAFVRDQAARWLAAAPAA